MQSNPGPATLKRTDQVKVDFCRLTRRHSLENLPISEREKIAALQTSAQQSIKKCVKKLQPYYEQGSLIAVNFWISEQRFNQPHPPAPEYHYDIVFLQPDENKSRKDLAIAALMPWVRLLVVAFEIMERCDDTLWRYYVHASAAVCKLENDSKLNGSLSGSFNGRKKRTVEMSELHKKIIAAWEAGYAQKKIAIDLSTSKATVSKTIKKFKES